MYVAPYTYWEAVGLMHRAPSGCTYQTAQAGVLRPDVAGLLC